MRESDEANNKRIILQRKFPKFKHAYTAIELIDEMHEKSQSKANDQDIFVGANCKNGRILSKLVGPRTAVQIGEKLVGGEDYSNFLNF